jgi:hypothetical protein
MPSDVEVHSQSFSISYEFHTNESCEWTCSFECDGMPMRCSRVASGSTTYEHDKARNGDELFSLMFSEVVETGQYCRGMT